MLTPYWKAQLLKAVTINRLGKIELLNSMNGESWQRNLVA